MEDIGFYDLGDSIKANDMWGNATDNARCEDMGSESLVTDDPDDCIMATSTQSATPWANRGCC